MWGDTLLLSKNIIIKWNNRCKKYYESKGYLFTNYGKEFEVDIKHLQKGSNTKVNIQCDYCGETFKKNYYSYIISLEKSTVKKDCCRKCISKKTEESNIIAYGVKNVFQLESTKDKSNKTNLEKYGVSSYTQTDEYLEKRKKTCLKKYGVENPLQNEEIMNKIRLTNLEKYGCENVLSNKDIQNKVKETCIERYGVENYCHTDEYREKVKHRSLINWGVEHPFQSEEVKDKIRNKNIEKYGYPSVMQNPEIKAKAIKTMYENGDCKTSSQQIEVFNLLEGSGYDVHLNYPISNCNLDIGLFVDKIKIDVEYDGWFWHQDKQRDRRRDEFLKSQGWKVLRIRSGRKIPSEKEIVDAINILVKSDRNYMQIILDDWKNSEEVVLV